MLGYLELDQNSLTGLIPQEIENLPSLVYLDLRYNSFNGIIPGGLCHLNDIEKEEPWIGMYFDCNESLCGCSTCAC